VNAQRTSERSPPCDAAHLTTTAKMGEAARNEAMEQLTATRLAEAQRRSMMRRTQHSQRTNTRMLCEA